MVDIIGHAAYVLAAVGTQFIGRKKAIGWLFRLISCLMWLGLGIHLGLSSIWFWEVIFAGQCIMHGWQWKKDNGKD